MGIVRGQKGTMNEKERRVERRPATRSVLLQQSVTDNREELVAALARLLCGILGHDTETVEYYDGLKNDAINEARAVLAKTEGGVK